MSRAPASSTPQMHSGEAPPVAVLHQSQDTFPGAFASRGLDSTLQMHPERDFGSPPGFEVRGFQNEKLDGIYVVRREETFQVHGRLCTGIPHPTPSYWNSESPDHVPVFMYWQYYKDHYCICPQFDNQGADRFAQVRDGAHGEEGVAFAFY